MLMLELELELVLVLILVPYRRGQSARFNTAARQWEPLQHSLLGQH